MPKKGKNGGGPRPTGDIDAGWFQARVAERRRKAKLAKLARKKNRRKK